MLQKYEALLRRGNMSEHSVSAYMYAVRFYLDHYPAIDKKNLLAYKGFLLENYKPKTVNLRIQAINKFLQMLKKERLCLKAVKVQQKNFLENVRLSPRLDNILLKDWCKSL